ncbi:MAG: phosphoribosylanthranilate isomerase [Microthrixaceae bacterium]
MFVKICGLTNEEDALMAVALGADAVGFVFAPSPRQVSPGAVRDITRRLPPEILTVGVFRDQAAKFVIETVQFAGLRGAQLHGHETPADAAKIRPYCQVLIVAFAAGDPGLAHVDDYGADAVLLDSHAPGSGQVFDWSLAEGAPANRRLILAGGLTAANVTAGIEEVRPWGVDVSSGVEVDGEPGRKDALKVQAFIHAAKSARPAGAATAVASDPDADGPFDWAESGL